MNIIREHHGNHDIAIILFPRIVDDTGIVTSEYRGFTINPDTTHPYLYDDESSLVLSPRQAPTCYKTIY